MVRPLQDRTELAKYFAELGFKEGVEIGVAEANYSVVLLDNIPGLKLHLVDPWEKYSGNQRGGGNEKQHGNYKIMTDKLMPYGKDHKIVVYRKISMEAVREFEDESLDFVYIDGNHNFDYVMEDLVAWGRKVKVGGIISGHDYYHFTESGVVEAVDAYIKGNNIREWYLTPEREGSWYFFKTKNNFIKVKGWK